MEWDWRTFRERFPHLAEEISQNSHIPSIMDHFERCSGVEEALELIEFFYRHGEISKSFAESLKKNMDALSRLFNTRKPGEYTKRGILKKSEDFR
jgi:hypothetical protein